MKKIFYSLNILIFILIFTGCANQSYYKSGSFKAPDGFERNLPKQVKLDVPIAQEGSDGYSCATHSLAMVMAYHDNLSSSEKKYGRDAVWKASGSSSYDVAKRGNDMKGLANSAHSFGFNNTLYVPHMTIKEAKYLLSQELPLVINVRNFLNGGRGSHAVVLTGYDESGFFL